MIQKVSGVVPAGARWIEFPSSQQAVSTGARQIRIAEPAIASDVAMMLAGYLSERLGANLAYSRSPEQFADGWETHTYAFQFQTGSALAPVFDRPLVLRIYPSRECLGRARHEFAVLRHLFGLGFPVTEPLLLEEDCRYFGGPFLIRAEAPGDTLLRAMLRRPRRLWTGPRQMAALQARLHQLSTDGFPDPPEPLLPRSLDEMAEDIRSAGWRELVPGLDWLSTHRPAAPAAPKILHLDFHPMNLIRESSGLLVPIDWTDSDVGDPHADIGTSLVLSECTPPKNTTTLDRLGVGAGRFFFVRWYLRAYRKRMPIDGTKLAYYRAWAALRRLCRYGKWLNGGPRSGVCKACAVRQIQPGDWKILEAYFERWTEVQVRLFS